MFMQAGFALVETGLCRYKNDTHHDDEHADLPAGHAGILCLRVCLHVRRSWYTGRGTLEQCASLSHEWAPHLFGHDWGLIGLKGFFLGGFWKGDSYDAGLFCRFCSKWFSWIPRQTIPTGAAADGEVLGVHALRRVYRDGDVSRLRKLGLGRRLAVSTGCELRPRPRARGFCRFFGSSHARRRDRIDIRLADWPAHRGDNKHGTINAMPAHNIPMAYSAPSFWFRLVWI